MQLDLQKYVPLLKVKTIEGQRYIYAETRKKYLVLTPEEMIRQVTILYLVGEGYFSKNSIREEMTLKVNDLTKRCDLLIFDKDGNPFLLIECKRAKVPITQAVFAQIARYNLTLKVPYLMVTNGIQTYCCAINYETEDWTFLANIPSFED